MHPASINHLGVTYSLIHLRQEFRTFSWTCEDKAVRKFSVRVRYTNHCYSDDPPTPIPPGAHMVPDKQKARMFCPHRHAHSQSLPAIIDGLFVKPVTTLCRTTQERNWSMYRLQMTPQMANGSKYYVFLQMLCKFPEIDGVHFLDLWVQSAYERHDPVFTDRRFTFGRVAERVALGIEF